MKRRSFLAWLSGSSLFPGCNTSGQSFTPQSRLGEDVGIDTLAGFRILIRKGTLLPAGYLDEFSTSEDCQSAVALTFLAGDWTSGHQLRRLGMFVIDEIDPAPRGIPRIEVGVKVTESGLVEVAAIHRGTGKSTQAQLGPVATE